MIRLPARKRSTTHVFRYLGDDLESARDCLADAWVVVCGMDRRKSKVRKLSTALNKAMNFLDSHFETGGTFVGPSQISKAEARAKEARKVLD